MQQEEPYTWEDRGSSRNFVLLYMKYNFHSGRSIMFTNLRVEYKPKRNQTTYKVDTRINGNLMPFRMSKILFPKSTVAEVYTRKNNTVMLKTLTNIEQLGMCTMKIR